MKTIYIILLMSFYEYTVCINAFYDVSLSALDNDFLNDFSYMLYNKPFALEYDVLNVLNYAMASFRKKHFPLYI